MDELSYIFASQSDKLHFGYTLNVQSGSNTIETFSIHFSDDVKRKDRTAIFQKFAKHMTKPINCIEKMSSTYDSITVHVRQKYSIALLDDILSNAKREESCVLIPP